MIVFQKNENVNIPSSTPHYLAVPPLLPSNPRIPCSSHSTPRYHLVPQSTLQYPTVTSPPPSTLQYSVRTHSTLPYLLVTPSTPQHPEYPAVPHSYPQYPAVLAISYREIYIFLNISGKVLSPSFAIKNGAVFVSFSKIIEEQMYASKISKENIILFSLNISCLLL